MLEPENKHEIGSTSWSQIQTPAVLQLPWTPAQFPWVVYMDIPRRPSTHKRPNLQYTQASHQGNPESASVKLKVLETMGSTIHALRRALPVLTASSKRVEAHGIVAEYFFPHWLVPRALDLDRVDGVSTWNKH